MTDEQMAALTSAISRLAYGPSFGPGSFPSGFEALCMALSGSGGIPGGDGSVACGLNRIADAIDGLSQELAHFREEKEVAA